MSVQFGRYHGTVWDKRDMALLGKMYAEGKSFSFMSDKLHRSENAIRARVGVLRIVVKMAEYADQLEPVTILRKRKKKNGTK